MFPFSAFGGAAIAIGVWTYGYNIMRNLGNRLTLHSPARGFSMELGSVITVIIATQLGMSRSSTLISHIVAATYANTSFSSPRLYHSVYHRRHRRCRSLLRHLAHHQLAHGRLDLHGLDPDPPLRGNHVRLSHRYHRQRPPLGLHGVNVGNEGMI